MSGNEPFPAKSYIKRPCFFLAVVALVAVVSLFASSQASAAVSAAKAASEKTLSARVLDFLKGEDLSEIPSTATDSGFLVKVLGSRLPNRTEPLRDVPANVTYLGKDYLEETQPLTFQDAVREAEGITLYDAVGNGLDRTFSMRGFAGSSDVTFLVDGVRVNEIEGNSVTFPLLVMNDMESIQIERGSGSPVYGSGAFAGVVNLTTGRPSPRPFSLFGGLEFSSFSGIKFHDGVSGTLKDNVTPLGGNFVYYFNGSRDLGEEGFRENGEWRITSFNFKTGYELADDQGGIHFGFKRIKDAVSNPGELTFQQFRDEFERSNKPLDGRDFVNHILQIDADKKFWDDHINTSLLTNFRENKSKAFTTFGTFTDFPDGFNPDTNLVTIKNFDKNITGQAEYEDQWRDVGNKSLIGLELRKTKSQSLQQDAFRGVIQNTATETDRAANSSNVGLFWRETLNFFDKVIPYFGMRHDLNWLSGRDFLAPANNLSKRWSSSTLSTGLTVKPVSWNDLFFNYSQGFRVPTVDQISPFTGALSTNLQPERADSCEVGTRLRLKDLAKYKTSFFLIDLEDEIAFDSNAITTTAPFGQNVNIAKSRRYGLEQRLDLDPLEGVHLYGSYAWTRAYVAEHDPSRSLADGRTLGQIPENRFTLGGYVQPLYSLGENYKGFRLGLDGVFTGRQHPSSYQSASQATLNATGGAGHNIKPYSVWNFMASYTWRKKKIYFRINNVFDEKYYDRAVSATSFGTALYPAGTFTFVNPGAPREFVWGSSWEF